MTPERYADAEIDALFNDTLAASETKCGEGHYLCAEVEGQIRQRIALLIAQRDAARAAHARLREAAEPYFINAFDECNLCGAVGDHTADCPLAPLTEDVKP